MFQITVALNWTVVVQSRSRTGVQGREAPKTITIIRTSKMGLIETVEEEGPRREDTKYF